MQIFENGQIDCYQTIPHLCPSSKLLKLSHFANHHCASVTVDFAINEEISIVKLKASDMPKITPSIVKVNATFVFAKSGQAQSFLLITHLKCRVILEKSIFLVSMFWRIFLQLLWMTVSVICFFITIKVMPDLLMKVNFSTKQPTEGKKLGTIAKMIEIVRLLLQNYSTS